MAVLWLRFSDDTSLPAAFGAAERKKLEEIYDAVEEGSVWNRAATALGMPRAGGQMLKWHKGAPYINWSLMTTIVSCGSIEVVADAKAAQGYAYAARATLLRLPALMKSQWCAALYVERKLSSALPQGLEDRVLESTTLGLALQSMMLRLPKHSPRDFADWLSNPAAAPAKVRRTVLQLQSIQKRRTGLSGAWRELFPAQVGPEREGDGGELAYFWDDSPVESAAQAQGVAPAESINTVQTEFQGLPVCAGRVTGRGIAVVSLKNFAPPDMSEFPILVFACARPETVEVFSQASALLFAEGGALSHACTVAREQGVPCVTGLGPAFWALLRERTEKQKNIWLTVDGAAGLVKIVKAA